MPLNFTEAVKAKQSFRKTPKRKKNSFIALFSALALLFSFGSAALVYGTIYDENLDPLNKAVVTINSTPNQRIVAANGSYSLQIAPGAYLLSAAKNNYTAEQYVEVTGDGSYAIDLVLFAPAISEDNFGELASELEKDGALPSIPEEQTVPLIAAVAVLAIAALVVYIALQRKTRAKTKQKIAAAPKALEHRLSTDQEKVLGVLHSFNGRATQKELRKALSEWSEAKVSMELTELEDLEKIRKIRKGRGNIVRLA